MSNKILLTEGKTKEVYPEPAGTVLIVSKNDITAGNGEKHSILPGKAEWSTSTTCNVFAYLERQNIQTAFIERVNFTTFRALLCKMFPLEVVIRGEAHGSYLKRNPSVEKGYRFSEPIVEFYLKTKGKVWNGIKLPCDDPLMEFHPRENSSGLSKPDEENAEEFTSIPILDIRPTGCDYLNEMDIFSYISVMNKRAKLAFIALKNKWSILGYSLVDLKIEFGFASMQLVIADVVDNDSWRLLNEDGNHMDKQVYRDGEVDSKLLKKISKNYAEIARVSAEL